MHIYLKEDFFSFKKLFEHASTRLIALCKILTMASNKKWTKNTILWLGLCY